MAREFDVIVFGATGVTGRYTCEQMFRAAKEENLSWAVAGRTESKLIEALKEVASWIQEDPENFSKSIPKIIADVSDAESLKKMASRCRIVVNTVGPYILFGEPVVAACVEAGTNHVDVSAEPPYIESMQLKYHDEAKQKKIFIISSCGFDSIPYDLTLSYAKENFSGRLNSVETYLSFKSGEITRNTGTWESIIHGVSYRTELEGLRKQTCEKLFTKHPEKPKFELATRGPVSLATPSMAGYRLPFPGSDRSVVLKSEMFRHETEENYKPVQLETYFILPSMMSVMILAVTAALIFLFAKFELGRKLLIKYPGFFSHGAFGKGGPTREQCLAHSVKIVGYGKGWLTGDDESQPPTKEIVVVLEGPNPGYIATSTLLVQTAVCVLKDNVAMPFGGGCLSPGFALEKTTIMKRIQERGFKFSVRSQSLNFLLRDSVK